MAKRCKTTSIQKSTLLSYDCARRIPLTHGKFAIVDPDDYDRLSQHNWRCTFDGNTYYAYTFCYKNRKNKKVFMHRLILNAPKGLIVDHIDGNGLNNRKKNLRLCTWRQNAFNRGPKQNSSSRYKGLSWQRQYNKWYARISYKGKGIYLGRYDDETEAALAYDRKAEQLFGEFAYLNFPQLAEFREALRKIIFAA